MGLFKDWYGSRYIVHLFLVNLLSFFGWLSAIASGQLELSDSVSGAVSFPDLGITCLGNLAVLYSSILRGGLYLEMGAKDALTFLTGRIKLKKIEGLDDTYCFGLTTCEEDLSDCSVVMLSQDTPNSSMRQFVEYIANVYEVRSIILQYFPLESVALTAEICSCPLRAKDRSYDDSGCGCIVFSTGENEAITIMLAEQIPGTLKRLPDGLCLLPSLDCLRNGCHGCDQGLLHLEDTELLHVEESDTGELTTKRLSEHEFNVECPAAVCGTPYSSIVGEPATCICIPVPREGYDRVTDRWTELLIGSFKSKDYETRGVMIKREKSSVSHDLKNYVSRSGPCYAEEEYSIVSLIVPRLTEILINLALTLWFKVDGFSSALVARRAIKNYIVDSRVNGFAAHVFITKAEVKSNDVNSNVYQLLSFRGNLLNPRTLSFIVGSINLLCSIIWAVLVASEGYSNKWYHTHSLAPSKPRVAAIFAAIVVALGMDCLDFYRSGWPNKKPFIVLAMIVFEIVCIVSGSVVARALGIKAFGRWLYGAVQGLVWLKWGIGSYLRGQYIPLEQRIYGNTPAMYMYSSAFLLNAVLAGARAKWKY